MKKLFLLAAVLATVASCTEKEIGTDTLTAPAMYGYTEDGQATKTAITVDGEGVGTIWWKPADNINVFFGTTSVKYYSTNTKDATTVVFETNAMIGSTESASDNKWGLYPYNAAATSDGTSVTTTIPASQQCVPETFGSNLFPMLAHTSTNELHFKNVCGGIKFSLSRNDIQSITFRGNNNEDIVGKVKLSFDGEDKPVANVIEGEKTITLTPNNGDTFDSGTNYYLVMLPTVLSGGFTMTFDTENEIGTFEYTAKSIEIKRSIFAKKSDIDSYATFIPKEIAPDNSAVPLTITSSGNTSVSITKVGTPNEVRLDYRVGEGVWGAYTMGQNISLADGEYVQFRNNTYSHLSRDLNSYYTIITSGVGRIIVSGNIMSLLDSEMRNIEMSVCEFAHLFDGCSALIDASNLTLPATKLAESCYVYMFANCTSLTTPPALPATMLAENCYGWMFLKCTNLTNAPALPATYLASKCYSSMFSGCKSLTTAPELPATSLASYCYQDMFRNCTNLTIAPELPATSVSSYSYSYMFNACTSLTTAPALPATTLASYCYENMFGDCRNLTTAPELPATKLAPHCYQTMFYNCRKLTTAPALPATTLADTCYGSMFMNCTDLTTAPELPSTTLTYDCYSNMFFGCVKLNYVKALFKSNLSGALTKWLYDVSSTGTFVKSENATWNDSDVVPLGWTVVTE